MTLLRSLTALTTFASVSLVASMAAAKPNFPGEIESYLNLSYAPPCAICHIDGVTGGQTVVTPFGYSIVSHGLSGGRSGMGTALDAMKSSGVDSDGDGVSDIDELVKGTDPNSAASGPLNGQRSSTGCAVRPEGAGGEGALAGLMMGIALVLGMRRRR